MKLKSKQTCQKHVEKLEKQNKLIQMGIKVIFMVLRRLFAIYQVKELFAWMYKMHTDKPVNIKAQCCFSHFVFRSNFLYFPSKTSFGSGIKQSWINPNCVLPS